MTEPRRSPKTPTQHARDARGAPWNRRARRTSRPAATGTSRPATTDPRTDRPTMRDVQHTHPYTGESFQTAYTRGPVVSDGGAGGERGPDEETHPSPRTDGSGTDHPGETESEGEEATDPAATADPAEKSDPAGNPDTAAAADAATLDEEMRDVDHTPPDDDEGANRVWERGAENRDRHR